MTRDRFVDIAPGLLQPDWDLPEGAGALLTTRAGGQSTGPFASFNLGGHVGDDPAAVAANRARLRRFLPADPLWLEQVHGADVVDAERFLRERGAGDGNKACGKHEGHTAGIAETLGHISLLMLVLYDGHFAVLT